MAFEKQLTAKQVAELVLKKTHELLEKHEHIGWGKMHGKLKREGYSEESADKIAGAIKAKVHKSEEVEKSETGHEKGIHTQSGMTSGKPSKEGVSAAGSSVRSTGGKGGSLSSYEHQRVTNEMKQMPTPNLPKSEDMDKGELPTPDHTGTIHHEMEHKGKKYKIQINPDIAARGGHKGNGTTTHIWTDKGLKGYQGPHSKSKTLDVIKQHLNKSEDYKPENSKKENAKPSEHNSKEADQNAENQHAQGKANAGEIHPKEHVEGASDDVRTQKDPQHNPKENAEGNNELAGTTPTQVGQDGKNIPGGDEIKGHLKLAKFIGHMEHKRKSKQAI